MNSTRCPHCGGNHPAGARFCPMTGRPMLVLPAASLRQFPVGKWALMLGFVALAVAGSGLWIMAAGRDIPSAVGELSDTPEPVGSQSNPITPTLGLALAVTPGITHMPGATASVTPTITPTATPTSVKNVETFSIGHSVLGQPLEAIRIGNGQRAIVIAGALHGTEANAARLVETLAARFANLVEIMPPEVRIYFLPRLNPDGLASDSRYNANRVNLNRNWDTNDWQPDSYMSVGVVRGGGGAYPFSEPETAAFASFLLAVQSQSAGRPVVVIYHSAYPPSGLVQPGYRLTGGGQETDAEAAALASAFAGRVGYEFAPTWADYPITGEAIHWCADNDIICFDVELPSHDDLSEAQVQGHLSAILGLLGK